MPLTEDNKPPKIESPASPPALEEMGLNAGKENGPLSNLPNFDRIRGVWIPITVNLFGTDPATAANYDVFFTADFPCEVIEAMETHRVAGTDAGAVTLDIEKLTSGQALDAGAAILESTFSLKSTADTPVRKKGTLNSSNKVLKPGDRLALKDSGTLTAVAGLSVTVYIRPLSTKLQNL